MGPSGCGKSTTLRMLAGLEPVDRGPHPDRRARPGRRTAAGPGHRHGVPELRAVPEHVRRRQHGLRAAQRRCQQGRDSPAGAGGGADARAGAACWTGGRGDVRWPAAAGRHGPCIVRDPKVFCMDEPLSNLDAKLRVSTRAQIAALQRELGITTVYVTHDQVEAMTMGDRVAVLRDGVLQQVATPQELYDAPGQHLRGRFHRVAGDEPDALRCTRGARGPVRRAGARWTAAPWAIAGRARWACGRSRGPCSGTSRERCGDHRHRGVAGFGVVRARASRSPDGCARCARRTRSTTDPILVVRRRSGGS